MKRLSVWMVLAVVGCTVVGSAAAEDECGGKGQKPCPMQGWMEDHVQVPMEKGDYKKVAEAMEKAAKMAPDPAWNKGDKSWEKMSLDSAAAAKTGDLKAIKKSCKGCHKAWRKEYKKKYLKKPVPKV